MGAYAKDTFFNGNTGGGMIAGGGSSPANNGSYAGSARASIPSIPSTVPAPANNGSFVGSVSQAGSKTLTNYDASNLLTNITTVGVGMGLVYYTDAEKEAMTDAQRSIAEKNESLQKVVETQDQKTKDVKAQTKAVADSVSYEQGQTLPSVLSQNAKALTQAINALTTTFTDQFTLLNNYMMGGLIYQQQFLDIKTAESGLKIESMEFQKTQQTVYDLDGNALGQATPRDLGVQKDAVVGIDHTDKINFSLDDDGDLEDIMDGVDITGIFGYDSDADVIKEAFNRLGGVGL